MVVLGQVLAVAGMVAVAIAANAQMMSTGVGVSGSGYASPGVVMPGSVPTPMPTPPPPITDSGFIQFNNLSVESVSASNPPAEILATNPNIYTIMGSSGSGVIAPSAAQTVPSSGTCYKFSSQSSVSGSAIACPTTPATNNTTVAPTAGTINSGTNIATPAMYPFRYAPYRIEVDAATQLSLRDRTPANLNSFSSGDQINVFGYYNADGSIQAYLIRNLSKPTLDEFIQLNNVQLAAITTSTTPNTLVVVQQSGYPCYGFGTSGVTKQSIACPMGIQSSANNAALQNISVPSALMPTWEMVKKTVVKLDAQTILLDNNRTRLQLSDLRIGDQLNVYGDTTDNGQTLNADIVRDLSIPPAVSNYSGWVTQVNADGSFIIQTPDGRIITVRDPIQSGVNVQITGILDRLQNELSQVSNIFLTGKIQYNPL